MLIDKSGRFCLATLEFAFTEQESLMTTHCPSCGLKLVIKHEFLVNRFSSLGLIIGISALIGYHIGANKNLIKQFCRKLLRLFNLDNHQQSSSSSTPSPPSTNIRKVFLKNGQSRSLQDCSSSDDSAVDIYYWSDYEDLDDPNLHELMINQNNINNNQYYFDDYFFCLDHPNQKSNQLNPSSNYYSKTVDKIDQVLHQIDDIKKSIVEIDGELYHVTGSKYANFNPDFLTLTDFNQMEEFEENSNQKRNTNLINLSSSSSSPSTTRKLRKRQKSLNNFNDLQNKFLVSSFSDNSYDDDINSSQQSSQLRKLSRMSLDFSSQENLQQLEWDESECNYFSFHHPFDLSKNKEESHEQNHSIRSTTAESEIMMTDEEKLQTTNYVHMQELLEEAKRLGLLNNLIDAFLNQSSSSSIGLKSTKEKDNLSNNHYNCDNNSSEDENF